MSDVLREVVRSPWFDIGAPLLFDDTGTALADHHDNVGWLLSMLRASGLRVSLGCDERGRWEAATSEPTYPWREFPADTPCQALCAALLALPEKP